MQHIRQNKSAQARKEIFASNDPKAITRWAFEAYYIKYENEIQNNGCDLPNFEEIKAKIEN